MNKPEFHDFWVVKERPESPERLEFMLELREYISNMPKTKLTFRPTKIAHYPGEITDEMLWMVGSWEMSDFFAKGSQRGKRWINPNHPESYLYPDTTVKCECGAFISRGHQSNLMAEGENEHTDFCNPYDRLRSRADMLERRKEVILRGLKLGLRDRDIAYQIGVRAGSIGEISKRLNIHPQSERDEYKKYLGRTYAELYNLGMDRNLISEAYDMDPSTMAMRTSKSTNYEWDRSENKWIPPYHSETKMPDWISERVNAD